MGELFIISLKELGLTRQTMNAHAKKEIVVAHSLINSRDIVENMVIDYNGKDTQRFWHRVQLLLREEGVLNFTAYETKTPRHLHLYIHKGHTAVNEAYQLKKMLSMKLASRMPKQWRVFPNQDLPKDYNILTFPYWLNSKERGLLWSRDMLISIDAAGVDDGK